MKRILSLILSVIMLSVFSLLFFTGCISYKEDKSSLLETETTPVATSKKHSKELKLTNGFDCLATENQRKCYEDILANTKDFTSETKSGRYLMKPVNIEEYNLSLSEVSMIVDGVFGDNPQIFWIDLDYTYTTVNSAITEIQFYSVMSESQYLLCKKQLNKRVKIFVNSAKELNTDFEKELLAHDFIIDSCEYESSSNPSDSEPYTAYGALVSQKAVCQGYTKAFQLLLSKVGINSINISGVSENQNHIWNAVMLDDNWYYVDVTWDDNQDRRSYDYFNITTKQLKKNHTINPTFHNSKSQSSDDMSLNFYVPKCTNSEYNYYYKFGSHLEDMNNNTLAEDLAKTADRKDDYFYIYVDPDTMNFTMTYDQLFSDTYYGFANYIFEANKLTENQLSTTVSIYKNKNINVITVKLNYK